MIKFNADEFLDCLISGSDNTLRNSLIPRDVKLVIGRFRHELYSLEEDPGTITVLIQYAGRLGLLGQYGYIDLLNEQYIKYNTCSSPTAMPVADVKKHLLSWIPMLKTDFFDKELAMGDIESAQTSLEDMKSIEMWAMLTDQFDVSDILAEVRQCLAYMTEKMQGIGNQSE